SPCGGVAFHPATAVELLRRNLTIYGVGGLVSAFVGIKVFYLALSYLFTDPAFMAVSEMVRGAILGL
ncbi:MAG: hypothetical protein M1144_01240, partial [Candidatus Thermoplasmatota archaeon]|nr:hypothetical protein [Candidatus Thermoplasmatota archaeon]